MDASLHQQVCQRPNWTCEYCRIPRHLDPAPFQIDHIIAQQHLGRTTFDNLALSCFACNKHKGPNIASVEPDSGAVVPLFHPHRDSWHDHFEWNGPEIIGRTSQGRATILVLAMNLPHRVALREALIDEGVFPPR